MENLSLLKPAHERRQGSAYRSVRIKATCKEVLAVLALLGTGPLVLPYLVNHDPLALWLTFAYVACCIPLWCLFGTLIDSAD